MLEDIGIVLNFLTDDVPEKWLEKTDAIFVFGNTDRRLAEHAAKLYFAGKGKKIVVSGSHRFFGPIVEGFRTEDEFFVFVMEKFGVPREDLISSNSLMGYQSSKILENVFSGMKAAHDLHFYPKSLILVALPYELRRARATFAKHFPDITTFGSTSSLLENKWKDAESIRLLLAEVDRLKSFSRRGRIVPVHIPRGVEESYRVLSFLAK